MASSVDYAASSLGDPAIAAEFEEKLSRIRSNPSPVEPHYIGGRELVGDVLIERFDPCVPSARVGAACEATAEQVTTAVEDAHAARGVWRRTPFPERVGALRTARETVAFALVELAAIVSAETGKTRVEAIGEANEVLDMIDHYCRLMEDNDGYCAPLASTASEQNSDVMVPYGTFAVITPFNFPIALTVGMVSAAIVTGNTVVLKPSDKTPRSTATVARMLAEQLPDGVLNIVHGGAEVGRMLAASTVDGIAFTGSAKVGWDLIETRAPSGLPRPVLAEMGGQNPAIVTGNADLAAAARGVARSAFGLSGQKCSACRRVVVDAAVAEEFTALLVSEAEALTVGDPLLAATSLGPLVDDSIGAQVDQSLAEAERDGKVLTGGRLPIAGNFFAPIVVSDLPMGHRLTREELFAPFVTVTRVDGLDAAISEANAVEYGLSAGIFSTDQAEIDRFLDEIEAGVVYVNRAAGATTGAWPGKQSFCGWKRSGSHGKGGLGNWYLQSFMREQSRTIVSEL
ncbi:aldehyde dehydrogenase family protein [Mycolicibacterium baixiangningiae]|uniref:aldehyde dehydrogenase family protein n=1 Tax=Mycolicibacterium baixiangningiae TaxID=2761578 RepID=UPI0018D16DDB|nr:aldehyde dehydrogenase family protein [Mycolicibacterium baixiangningiae]